MRFKIVGDGAADLTLIEVIATGGRQPRDGPCQVGLHEAFALLVPASVRPEENALGLQRGTQLLLKTRVSRASLSAAPEFGDVRVDVEAPSGEPFRRPKDILP